MPDALAGEGAAATARGRTWLDWLIVAAATAVFVGLARGARVPDLALDWPAITALAVVMLALLGGTGLLLWRTTRFN